MNQYMFEVFPSDSFLIGLALGEYLRLVEHGEGDTFEDVLYRRVHPFVPDRIAERWTPIPTQRLPEGLVWEEGGLGEDRSAPDLSNLGWDDDVEAPTINPFEVAATQQFGRRGEQMFRIELDESEHTMLDSLVKYLTNGARTRWNDHEVVLRRWDRAVRCRTDDLGGESLEPKSLPKLPGEISKLIEILVRVNHTQHTFNVGRLLGQAFGECVAAEKLLICMDEEFSGVGDEYCSINPDSLTDRDRNWDPAKMWDNLVAALANDPTYRACFFSPDWIRNSKGFWNGRYFGFTRSDDPGESRLNRELCARTSLCMIVGGILGVLADKERDLKPIPRRLSIPRDASQDHIGEVLELAGQAILGERNNYSPEVPVAIMGHLIERLARELWTFGPKQHVSEVLHEKKRGGNTMEEEFARKAIFYYDVYRKPAEHPGDIFRCGVNEGPLFYFAMRALYDLAKRIVAEREKKK
jgi:hypothetical protein